MNEKATRQQGTEAPRQEGTTVHVVVCTRCPQGYDILVDWVFRSSEPVMEDGAKQPALGAAFVERLAKHLRRQDHPACRVAEPIREASCDLVPLEGTCLSPGAQEETEQSQEGQA